MELLAQGSHAPTRAHVPGHDHRRDGPGVDPRAHLAGLVELVLLEGDGHARASTGVEVFGGGLIRASPRAIAGGSGQWARSRGSRSSACTPMGPTSRCEIHARIPEDRIAVPAVPPADDEPASSDDPATRLLHGGRDHRGMVAADEADQLPVTVDADRVRVVLVCRIASQGRADEELRRRTSSGRRSPRGVRRPFRAIISKVTEWSRRVAPEPLAPLGASLPVSLRL
jgi:hypothetical protein